MAGNTRGKLKEKFESVHRNFEWVQKHCAEALSLIAEAHPNLSESIKALHEGVTILDECAQDIYAKL